MTRTVFSGEGGVRSPGTIRKKNKEPLVGGKVWGRYEGLGTGAHIRGGSKDGGPSVGK